MNLHYKIVSTNTEDHSLIARYWTDIITEDYLAVEFDYPENGSPRTIRRLADNSPTRCRSDVNITIYNTNANLNEIDKLVRDNAPVAWLSTLEKVSNTSIDTSMTSIIGEVGQVKTIFL